MISIHIPFKIVSTSFSEDVTKITTQFLEQDYSKIDIDNLANSLRDQNLNVEVIYPKDNNQIYIFNIAGQQNDFLSLRENFDNFSPKNSWQKICKENLSTNDSIRNSLIAFEFFDSIISLNENSVVDNKEYQLRYGGNGILIFQRKFDLFFVPRHRYKKWSNTNNSKIKNDACLFYDEEIYKQFIKG
jgi:hypothetical protein